MRSPGIPSFSWNSHFMFIIIIIIIIIILCQNIYVNAGQVLCSCGAPCALRTATESNRGRRFYTCQSQECGFFVYVWLYIPKFHVWWFCIDNMCLDFHTSLSRIHEFHIHASTCSLTLPNIPYLFAFIFQLIQLRSATFDVAQLLFWITCGTILSIP